MIGRLNEGAKVPGAMNRLRKERKNAFRCKCKELNLWTVALAGAQKTCAPWGRVIMIMMYERRFVPSSVYVV